MTAMSNPILKPEDTKLISGQPIDKNQVDGKVVLLVNIATQCGYTPQLDGLQKLHDSYSAKGFSVIGIPSNDFGGQTPEDGDAVTKFCKLNFGAQFPLTEKMKIKGSEKHPLIQRLLSGSKDNSDVAWNFEKFLVDRSGKVLQRFSSKVKPEDAELKKAIEGALNSK